MSALFLVLPLITAGGGAAARARCRRRRPHKIHRRRRGLPRCAARTHRAEGGWAGSSGDARRPSSAARIIIFSTQGHCTAVLCCTGILLIGTRNIRAVVTYAPEFKLAFPATMPAAGLPGAAARQPALPARALPHLYAPHRRIPYMSLTAGRDPG